MLIQNRIVTLGEFCKKSYTNLTKTPHCPANVDNRTIKELHDNSRTCLIKVSALFTGLGRILRNKLMHLWARDGDFPFFSFPVIFHLEMIIFAIENKVFFEALQNKERERNSLVSIS